MVKITKKEEAVLNLFWQNGPMFVKDLLEFYTEPKPHINTVSTFVRSLEAKGYLTHKERGGSFQYYPVISRQYYGQKSVENIVSRNFGSSYKSLVSCLVHDEKITVDEPREARGFRNLQNSDDSLLKYINVGGLPSNATTYAIFRS